MRQVNVVGFIGYSIFAAVPFLYELRALLDWSCTATTLSLFDWLKLEDIHTSLFMVTVSRKMRESRSLGDRQPRYAKFFQVCLPMQIPASRKSTAMAKSGCRYGRRPVKMLFNFY